MNNFRTLRKTTRRLGAGIALLALTVTPFWAQSQPVVQVPATCNVVVAGAGGTLGLGSAGGRVGNGGIVVMSDPFDIVGTGGNFVIIPNGTTSHSWRLWGDLSIQTTSTTTPTVTGSGLTQNIESYNKFKRVPSETVAPSTASLARSKGRVDITYFATPCNAVLTFDVFKSYPNSGSGTGYVPPIIGPGCWDPSTTVTYSVDPIASDNLNDAIGTDKYYWTITPAVAGVYSSSDGSSITFTTPSSVTGTYTIQCCYGRANAWDGDAGAAHTTCVSKTIGTAIANPTFTTAVPTCLNTGVTTFTATVSPIAGLNYSWSYAGSGTPTVVASGTQNQTVTVNGMNNDPGTLTLTVTAPGECAAKVFAYPVRRNLQPALVLGVSPSGACVTGPATLTVSLPAGATGNTPTWTISPVTSPALTITPGPSNTATVTVPSGALGGEYTVTATNATPCNTGSTSTKIRVKPVPTFTGTTPTCVTAGVNATFAVTVPGPGPFSYTWTTPGYTVVSGAGTASILLTPTATAGNVSVNVCTPGVGGCCTSITRTVGLTPAAPTINAPTCYNVGLAGSATYSIASPVAGTYNWTIASGLGTPATGTGTSINVATIGTPGTITNAVSVTLTTSCGTSPATAIPVTLTPNGTLSVFTGGTAQFLEVAGATGTVAYQWLSNCNTATPNVCGTCGTGNTTILNNPGTAGSWGAYVISAGCTTKVCANTLYGARTAQGAQWEASEQATNAVTLSPNPNGGEFEVGVQRLNQSADLIVFDAFGKEVFSAPLQQGVNRFDQKKLANGTYFLRITVDGTATMKKMEVIH